MLFLLAKPKFKGGHRMYGIVLMMAVSGGTDLPAYDMFEPAPKMTQTAYRHRRHGCCGGGGGGCYGGGYGGCHGGGYGGCHGGAYVGGCYGGYAGYAYGGYPSVYSGYASWQMPTSTYSTYYPGWGWAPTYSSYSTYYPTVPNGDVNQAPPAEQGRRAPAPAESTDENRPPE